MTECHESLESELSSSSESVNDLSARLSKAKPVSLPEEFVNWLGTSYGLQPGSIPGYTRCLGKFLKYARLVDPKRKPSLDLVWNASLISQFFKILPELYSTTTVPNFFPPIVAARKYLSFELDEDPANAMKLTEGLKMMANVAEGKKNRHYASERFNFKHTSKTMKLFHKNFYIGKGWRKYFKLGQKAKEAMLAGEEFKLSRRQMAYVNRYAMGVCAGTNCKRLGNYSLIKYRPAFKAICSAMEKFRKAHPNNNKIIKESAARVDRKRLAPTVLFIDECVKTHSPDHLVLINPRDVYALKIYAKYLRPCCPTPPQDDTLFVNSKGKQFSLADASHSFTALGKELDIPNLNVNNLRRSAETENLRDSASEDVPLEYRVGMAAATSKFIGHSTATAVRSYQEQNKVTSIQIANRLLFFMEERGHEVDSDDEVPANDGEAEADDEVPVNDGVAEADDEVPANYGEAEANGLKKTKKTKKDKEKKKRAKDSTDDFMSEV